MSQKFYLNILKIGIFLSFISVFLVNGKLLFPYITSKQIYFNILIEILLIIWIAFIVKYPSYRPKKSWISIGLISFLAAITISSFFGVDFNLSFWGDIERMLGVFHVAHFVVFYLIIITVMREWKDWRNLLIASVVAAVSVCLYGLTKDVHYSTIGNTAYVSGYIIFNIFFSLILIFRAWKGSEDKRAFWIYAPIYTIGIIIMLSMLRITHTRGAYVGIGMGLLVMLLLLIILNKSKKIKIVSLAVLAVGVILVSLIFIYPQSEIVRNNSILTTIKQISFKTVTFQTRLISWKAAAKDFPNHPILGTGHGNFAITFDKYFDPTFYNYTRAETYFDRAHNNLIGITSTTGLVGLVTYLSIFAAVGYYLIRGYRVRKKQEAPDSKHGIDMTNFILLTGLMAAYLVQNLAVFDSLVTYISLMIALGYIYWLSQEKEEEILENNKPLINKEIYTIFAVGLIMITIVYQYNLKPLKMLKGTIAGQIAFAQGDTLNAYEIYKETLSHNTVLDRDSRDSFVRMLFDVNKVKNLDKEKGQEIIDYAISLAEENIKYNPEDSLMQMMLAQILNTASFLNQDNIEQFNYYSSRALQAIDKSIESSPGRMPIYFQKAQIHITRDEKDKVIETLKYAVSLNEDYYDSTCQLAKIEIVYGIEDGYPDMDKCIDIGGSVILRPANYVAQLIDYYNETKDVPRLIKLFERLTVLDKTNAQVWGNLAGLYVETGEIEKAIKAATKVSDLDPSQKSNVDTFIRELEK